MTMWKHSSQPVALLQLTSDMASPLWNSSVMLLGNLATLSGI